MTRVIIAELFVVFVYDFLFLGCVLNLRNLVVFETKAFFFYFFFLFSFLTFYFPFSFFSCCTLHPRKVTFHGRSFDSAQKFIEDTFFRNVGGSLQFQLKMIRCSEGELPTTATCRLQWDT